MNNIEKLNEMIAASSSIVFFGGAGVSTESGIPDYRSVDGLYNQTFDYPPETMLSHSFFKSHTEEFFRFYHSIGRITMKHGKKYVDSVKVIDSTKAYDIDEAIEACLKTAKAKFDETVEVHVKLGVDGRHADQQVRGAIVLPNGTGKSVRVLAICKGDNVEKVFREQFDMNLIRVNAQERFLSKLAGVSDPERKRKIIGEEFIRVFEEESKKLGKIEFLCQGTIYPDVVESGTGQSAVIKSHHNVGGLPEDVGFEGIIEPLRDLFKDEVRKVGTELKIPDFLVWRQPFPGPGLAIRIMGDITEEKLDILKDADAIMREEFANAGLDKTVNQYFAVMTGIKSVGVMGDGRTYDNTIALRAVTTGDFMTADWARVPYDVLEKISNRIINEVRCVNRVVYDITSKPPATIEWE